MTKHSLLLTALMLVLWLPIDEHGQDRGGERGQEQAQGRDTMHVVRVALRAYSKASWSQRLILTPRSNIDRQMVARYGDKLDLADSARATTPTMVSVREVVFEGDTVVSVYVDNKREGEKCYLRKQVVLGKPAGSTRWGTVLIAPLEHVCQP